MTKAELTHGKSTKVPYLRKGHLMLSESDHAAITIKCPFQQTGTTFIEPSVERGIGTGEKRGHGTAVH